MTVAEARRNERLRRYEPRSMRFPVGNRSLRIEIPAAREWLRRGAWARSMGRHDEPPYWVEVWPAAMAVVWALARCDRRVGALAGKRVLDLGCGLGLPGVAAASLGARVTFSDREPDALAFAEWNGNRVAAVDGMVETVCGDWQRVAFQERFDVIVLADVTYRTVYHDRLLELAASALVPGGIVIHADPWRDESSAFIARMTGSISGSRVMWARGSRETSLGDKRATVRLVVAGAGVMARAWATVLGLEPQSVEAQLS